MLKIIMHNKVAEGLNVEGRRGDKLPIVKMKIYNIIIGKF